MNDIYIHEHEKILRLEEFVLFVDELVINEEFEYLK